MAGRDDKHPRTHLIRNSTAEFLIFTHQSGGDGIEVRYEDQSIWLTQKLMGTLFDVNIRTISEHLRNIFSSGELQKDSVIRKFRNTASDGKSYNTNFYNLDAIISVGYRVNSTRATQFRQWATRVLLRADRWEKRGVNAAAKQQTMNNSGERLTCLRPRGMIRFDAMLQTQCFAEPLLGCLK